MSKCFERKKLQRKVNKYIKDMNKNISSDDLWLGRFEAKQKNAVYYSFPDGGGELYSIIRIYDKQTAYYKDYKIDIISGGYDKHNQYEVWEKMNNFITKDCNVWQLTPPDRNRLIDFSKIEMPDEIMNKDYNFHINYSYSWEI